MKFIILAMCLVAPVHLLAAESFGGIFLDSSIPSFQLHALKGDLTYLYKKEKVADDESFQTLLELDSIDGPTLYNWIYNRVKYIIGEEYQIRGRNYVTRRDFQFPSTPLPEDAFDSHDAYGGSVIMSNIGAGLYLDGKKKKILKGIKLQRKKVYATTPRVGILQIGQGLFADRIMINDNINSEANTIKRLGTLFHEARHSDGNGNHIGFYHHRCPIGHSLYGFSACEPYANGSYTIDAVATKKLLEDCKSCSLEDRSALEAKIADSFDRVVVLSHLKTEQELLEEMESYKKVIDVYTMLLETSPSTAQTSQQELERWSAKYQECADQLEELRSNPQPTSRDASPEGDFSELTVEESSRLIENSLKR
ncbi:hypothetical protein [Halobacteriovorax marinus]|uniref:hypothetical protein n=1 Tax=Halobacteriovorax marinus TaxID=97084 RepID=UPI003A8D954E